MKSFSFTKKPKPSLFIFSHEVNKPHNSSSQTGSVEFHKSQKNKKYLSHIETCFRCQHYAKERGGNIQQITRRKPVRQGSMGSVKVYKLQLFLIVLHQKIKVMPITHVASNIQSFFCAKMQYGIDLKEQHTQASLALMKVSCCLRDDKNI